MKGIAPLAVLAALLAISCASIQNIPPRKTSDECLVLIHTTIMAEHEASRSRVFKLKLSANHPAITVPKYDDGFVMVRISGPEVRIVGIASNVQSPNEYGNSTSAPLDLELPYEPGKVVVADFTFAQKITKNEATRTTWGSWEFVDTSEADKARILELFGQAPGREAASWR